MLLYLSFSFLTFFETLWTVLLVANLFHPLDNLAVELFLKRNVRHFCRGSSTMPVLYAGRNPDDIAFVDLLNLSTLFLHPASTGGYSQGLAERMRVPRSPRTQFKTNSCSSNTRWLDYGQKRFDAHDSGKVLRRSLTGLL